MNKETRGNCLPCRLRKCLVVGMDPQMIRCPPKQRTTTAAPIAKANEVILPMVRCSSAGSLLHSHLLSPASAAQPPPQRPIHAHHRPVEPPLQHHPHLRRAQRRRSRSLHSRRQGLTTAQASHQVHRHSQSHQRASQSHRPTHATLVAFPSAIGQRSAGRRHAQRVSHGRHERVPRRSRGRRVS